MGDGAIYLSCGLWSRVGCTPSPGRSCQLFVLRCGCSVLLPLHSAPCGPRTLVIVCVCARAPVAFFVCVVTVDSDSQAVIALLLLSEAAMLRLRTSTQPAGQLGRRQLAALFADKRLRRGRIRKKIG